MSSKEDFQKSQSDAFDWKEQQYVEGMLKRDVNVQRRMLKIMIQLIERKANAMAPGKK